MKKIVYKVFSIRDYRGGAEDVVKTYVRVDMQLWDGPAYADMDSSVYEMDDFQDIHNLYCMAQDAGKLAHGDAKSPFQYEYSLYTKYIAKIKAELMSLQ